MLAGAQLEICLLSQQHIMVERKQLAAARELLFYGRAKLKLQNASSRGINFRSKRNRQTPNASNQSNAKSFV
jgi:hypothetical protein